MKKTMFSDEYLSAFFTEMALILSSGVSLGDGIAMFDGDTYTDPVFAEVAAGLGAGGSLSSALKDTGRFPDYSIKMLLVGEKTGHLEDTLRTLAAHYDSSDRLTRRIRGMVFYPSILMLLMLAVIVVLLVEVMPVFEQVYNQLGTGLTGLAGGFLRAGQALSSVMPAVLAVLALITVFIVSLELSERLRSAVIGLFSRGASGVAGKTADARFASALSIGMSSGLPIDEAIELAIGTAGESDKAENYRACAKLLATGSSIAGALSESGAFPVKYSRLIDVGVRSGSGDSAMEEAARRMQLDAEDATDRAVARVEPAMVIFVCVVIGLIMLSVMLPLLDIMSAIG